MNNPEEEKHQRDPEEIANRMAVIKHITEMNERGPRTGPIVMEWLERIPFDPARLSAHMTFVLEIILGNFDDIVLGSGYTGTHEDVYRIFDSFFEYDSDEDGYIAGLAFRILMAYGYALGVIDREDSLS